MQKLEPYIPKLFKRLIRCIAGSHLQVADRAMCFFENDYFLQILRAYKSIIFPMLVPVIATIADTHWHKVLQESLNALKTILKEIDYSAFEKAIVQQGGGSNSGGGGGGNSYSGGGVGASKSINLIHNPAKSLEARRGPEKVWDQLHKNARLQDTKYSIPVVPYSMNHQVGKHNGLENGNVYVLL